MYLCTENYFLTIMSRNREEAIAAGVKVEEARHNMKRRKPWHDYHRKGTYLLTLVVDGRLPVLGRLIMPTQQQGAHVELTELGKAIYNEEIKKIPHFYKMVEVWKVCIMPDHIHMIVRVKEDLPDGKHLGQVVAGFKGGCSRAWWKPSPCNTKNNLHLHQQGWKCRVQRLSAHHHPCLNLHLSFTEPSPAHDRRSS